MKNIIKKTIKFISSRLLYLMIGIFLAVSVTYVYAAWNDAQTSGSGEMAESNWNALVSEIYNKCGSNCNALATNATASGNALTESNWNNLVDLANTTLTDCTTDDDGKCFVNQTSKSALDTDLAAGNIKSGVNVFGVAGTYTGSAPTNCTADNGGTCYIGQATKSALDTDLTAANIKSGTQIFGVNGSYSCPTCATNIVCRGGHDNQCWTSSCNIDTDCTASCVKDGFTRYNIYTGPSYAIDGGIRCVPGSGVPGGVENCNVKCELQS